MAKIEQSQEFLKAKREYEKLDALISKAEGLGIDVLKFFQDKLSAIKQGTRI